MERNQYYQNIHRYLLQEMNEEERLAFEAEIAGSEELETAVEEERKILRAMQQAGDRQLKEDISAVHQKLEKEQFFEKSSQTAKTVTLKTFVMKKIIPYATAAIVLFLLVWGIFLRDSGPDITKEEIFAQHFEPEMTLVKDRIAQLESFGMAGQTTPQDSLREALQVYEAGNYDEAIRLLNFYLYEHPEDETAQFYRAMALFNLERYGPGLEALIPLTKAEDQNIQRQAKIYSALGYLQVDDGLDKARAIYNDMVNSSDRSLQQIGRQMLQSLDELE